MKTLLSGSLSSSYLAKSISFPSNRTVFFFSGDPSIRTFCPSLFKRIYRFLSSSPMNGILLPWLFWWVVCSYISLLYGDSCSFADSLASEMTGVPPPIASAKSCLRLDELGELKSYSGSLGEAFGVLTLSLIEIYFGFSKRSLGGSIGYGEGDSSSLISSSCATVGSAGVSSTGAISSYCC